MQQLFVDNWAITVRGTFMCYSFMFFTICTGIPSTDTSHQPGTGSILFSGLNCTGLESSLLNCSRDNGVIGSTNCEHSQDAAIYCFLQSL